MGVLTTHRINLSMWILMYSFSDTYYVWAACGVISSISYTHIPSMSYTFLWSFLIWRLGCHVNGCSCNWNWTPSETRGKRHVSTSQHFAKHLFVGRIWTEIWLRTITCFFLLNGFVAFFEGRENQTYPGTKSKSTALRAICVAAFCTSARRPRLEQNLDWKRERKHHKVLLFIT